MIEGIEVAFGDAEAVGEDHGEYPELDGGAEEGIFSLHKLDAVELGVLETVDLA